MHAVHQFLRRRRAFPRGLVVGLIVLSALAPLAVPAHASAPSSHTYSDVIGPCTPVTANQAFPFQVTCSFATDFRVQASSGGMSKTVTAPNGTTIVATSNPGCVVTGLGTSTVTYTSCGIPAGTIITETFSVSQRAAPVVETVIYNNDAGSFTRTYTYQVQLVPPVTQQPPPPVTQPVPQPPPPAVPPVNPPVPVAPLLPNLGPGIFGPIPGEQGNSFQGVLLLPLGQSTGAGARTPAVSRPAQAQVTPPPQPAATISVSGTNPLIIKIHANQFLDLTHSVVVNLDPGVQATSVQVSTGSANIQGSQVVWNGFTLNAGEEATAVVSLTATGGGVLTASGAPAVQSVSINALDQSGNPINLNIPGSGATIADVTSSCCRGGAPQIPQVGALPPRASSATRALPPATVTVAGNNPVIVTVHANQLLDFSSSAAGISINLDPEVTATSVQVSAGSATIQSGAVSWNPARLIAGDEAIATVTLTASGAPAVQSVGLAANDQSGSRLNLQAPGSGPTVSDVAIGCAATPGTQNLTCSSSGLMPLASAPQPLSLPSVTGGLPPARVTVSAGLPAMVTIHANQFLDFSASASSITLSFDPGVQATWVEVSSGSPAIGDSSLTWNGFTLNAGQEATAVLELVAGDSPAIQSIAFNATDQSGNPTNPQFAGVGASISDVASGCASGAVPVILICRGTGDTSTIPFSLSGGWHLAWTFGFCPDAASPLTVTVLNPDGSPSANPPINQTSGGAFGTQQYAIDGTFSLAVTTPCTWLIQVQQP